MTGSSIYLDTSPFIYYLEQNREYFDRVRYFFKESYHNNRLLFTSAVTIEEYCVYPLSMGNMQAIDEFNAFLNGMNISVVPVSREIAFDAAKLRTKYKGFKALDSIHLATPQFCQCDLFLTNDKQLRQTQEITVLTMDDLLQAQPQPIL